MSSLSHTSLVMVHWLAHRFSVEQVSSLGSVIGRTVGARTRRNTRTLANLAAAVPDTSPAEREVIARSMWDNFGRTIAETILIDRLVADPTRVSLANPELLADCGKDGRGTVFVGLHFGNWEVMTIPLLRNGQSPICVYKPLVGKEANAFVLRHRSPLYPGGLFPASRATLLRIARHVRAGGSICISADHRDSNGLSVPFFGRPAPSVTLPATLAARFGARVLAVRVDRLPNARFSVMLERIAVADTGNLAADTLATTATIQARLEAWIKADPGRWLWFYKRWEEVDVLPPRKQRSFLWRRKPSPVPSWAIEPDAQVDSLASGKAR
jgi:Kdo2-lipid IVA lauroyltransferase/acyltransferase